MLAVVAIPSIRGRWVREYYKYIMFAVVAIPSIRGRWVREYYQYLKFAVVAIPSIRGGWVREYYQSLMFAIVAIPSIIFFLISCMMKFLGLLNSEASKIINLKNRHSTLILLSFANCFRIHQSLFFILDFHLNKVQLFDRIS